MKENTFRSILIVFIISGILLLVVKSFENGIADPDTWWHLAAGKYMVENRTIPHQDIFSWTVAGQPWVTHEWLGEVFFYFAYLAGKFWGVLSLIILFTTLFLFFYWRLLSLAKGQFFIAALTFMVVGEMLYPFLVIRPQVLSYLFFVVFLYVLHLFIQKKDYLFILPLISLLWANSHGSFPLGPALVALFILTGTRKCEGEKIENHAWEPRQIKKLAAVFVLCLIAAAINPNWWRLLIYPLETIKDNQMTSNIQEWLSPNFQDPYSQIFLVYYLATFLILVLTTRKIQLTDLLLYLIFGGLSFLHGRFIPYSLLISGLLWPAYFQPRLALKLDLSRLKIAMLPALLILYVLVFALKAPPQTEIDYRFADKDSFPIDAAAYLKQNPPEGKMFNDYGWGGYLIWNLPEEKVFIDGRADIYMKKVFGDYLKVTGLKPEAASLLEEYRIGWVFMPAGSPLVQALKFSPRWSVLYEDKTAAILKKKS